MLAPYETRPIRFGAVRLDAQDQAALDAALMAFTGSEEIEAWEGR